jgi:hypothetical protein
LYKPLLYYSVDYSFKINIIIVVFLLAVIHPNIISIIPVIVREKIVVLLVTTYSLNWEIKAK